ncbi:MAG: hypothetical protein ACJ749_04730 [Flavisolibacter sp.]
MKRIFWYRQLPAAVLVTGFVITASAWQGQPLKTQHTKTDTVPGGNKKITNIDDALDQLDKARAELDRTMKDADWNKMELQLKESLKDVHIDAEKMKAQMAEAMKAMDAVKIQAEIDKAMKDVDFEKIKTNLDLAMKQVDMEKMKTEIDASMAKVDWKKINQEIQEASKVDMQKIEAELKDIGPKIQKEIANSRKELDKAKAEMKAYKAFIDALDRDGLIKKNENYKIEYRDGGLTINGKK